MVCRLNAGNLYTDWLLKVSQKILQLKNKGCGAQGTELEALEEIFQMKFFKMGNDLQCGSGYLENVNAFVIWFIIFNLLRLAR